MFSSKCPLSRRCLIIALACMILLYSVLPVPVRADPVTASVVGVSALLAVASILTAIGVRPISDSAIDSFSDLCNDIVSALPSEFLAAGVISGTFIQMLTANGITYIPQTLIEWIIDYISSLFSTSVSIQSSVTYAIPSDFTGETLISYNEVVNDFHLGENVYDADNNFLYNNAFDCSFLTQFDNLYAITVSLQDQTKPVTYFVVTDGQLKVKIGDNGLGISSLILRATSEFVFFGVTSADTPFVDYYTLATDSSLVFPSNYIVISGVDTLYSYSVSTAFDDWISETVAVSDLALDPAADIAVESVLPLSIADTVAGAIDRTLTDTISGTKTIADTVAIATDVAVPGSFDFNEYTTPTLRNFFPFCIPFDLYAMMQALCADPTPPVFTFATSFLGKVYTVEIDLSAWNGVAQTIRYMIIAIYIVALAVSTRKFIKW